MTLEFIFSMMVVFIIIYSLVMVLRWSGLDLAERRLSHSTQLTENIVQDYINAEDGPLKQIDPVFKQPLELKGTVR